ncbi:murein hydrolase activator EnvC [Aquamicrobium sp. LC103]|uniref:murein hydrolase activator EnvC family protein n=1 Tax=Aquamicrobium sp. LC103 TaxID=1120658 RepID=UPI000A3DA8ED|nr:murein hydrolase activator EnvC [Aquamicrobium sp. LC103]TKT82991.1 hypothetical protein XW59_003235 [Aquamicrobium sp. LC103]
MKTGFRFSGTLASTALALLLGIAVLPATAAQSAADLESRRDNTASEYERLSHEITLSEERQEEIAREIAAIRKDNASLSAALIQAAKTERKLGQDISEISAKVDDLRLQEGGIRESLSARRGVLAEVLAALQRMGLNPPPAILVKPEDALSSVRSAILLGAVVPELRAETEILIADLKELSRVTASIESERERLRGTIAEQVAEQERLSLLLEEKQRLQTESEGKLAAEKQRSSELAAEAGSLRELIDALEAEIETNRKAEEESRLAALKEAEREEARRAQPLNPTLPGRIPFSAGRGQVGFPVAGHVVRRFGQGDGSGGTMQGDMLATHSAAIVTAPSDSSVLYAGPFRSYGQLLILDAGDGYHVVLAGMGRISVTQGQSVLAGEPVGVMGEARVASAMAFGSENSGPELYVEFRKDGKPVDPAPWWAERSSGRTGNGT